MKHIVIPGGAGFIGANLTRELLARGHAVTVLDSFCTGRRENLAGLGGKNLEIIEHDVCQPFHFAGKVDEIYNLACPASPVHYQLDPLFTTRTCVMGALNLLELAREHGAKILQGSTSEVYGEPECHPQREDYRGNVNCIGIRSCYDEGKRTAESIFFDHRRMYGTRIKVVRIFNTYGPLMRPDDGRVVSNFIVQALLGRPLSIYGNGLQTRSFCFVDDLVRGLMAMMDSSDEITGPVNLGNPGEFTMLELAKLILDKTASKSILTFQELPADDPCRRKPDIALAQAQLGWNPQISLESGLDASINYFKTQSLSDEAQ